MELQLFGINHKTSNVAEREKFIINESNQILLDSHLKKIFHDDLESFFGISTCNRTEIYLVGKSGISEQVFYEILKKLNIYDISRDSFYFLSNHDALVHMCKVASGIDSQVLGEQEILGQFKTAVKNAKEYKIIGKGKVVAEFIDPSDYPDLEREANEKYQINPTPFQFADRYKSSVVNSYFNILIKLGEHHEILSFDDLIQVKAISENNISVHLRNPEYDITKTIRSVIDRHQSAGRLEQFIENPVSLTAFFSKDKDLPTELIALKNTVTNYLNDKKKDKNGKNN